jgi:STE24 endopeptidase
VAAWLLWRTSVPSLHIPHLDEHRYFTPAQLRASDDFSRFGDLTWLGATVVQLAVLVVYARRGAGFARESAAGPAGTGMLLGMLGFALVWLAQLPFTVADLWWQRRHHISHEGYASALFGNWFSLGGEFVFLCLTLAIVMGLARKVGRHWWLPAAPVFVGLAALFALVTPWLTPTHRLADPELRAAATRLEQREGVGHVPVVVQDVHDVTSLPNAEAMGLGPSRRIVVWDTLVDGRFSEPELRVVLAHEIGHIARGHIWKQIGWYALFAFPGAFLIALATRRRGGMGSPDAVPLALLVVVVLGLLALPLQNAISRHLEQEADWRALVTTRDPAADIGLMRRFVPTTLDEPDPSLVDYLVFANHPTLMQRIALAKAYAAAQSP